MPNRYPNEKLSYYFTPQPESPNSTRNRGKARVEAKQRRATDRREKANERYQLSKLPRLAKSHMKAARRKGSPIDWEEAKGRALDQIVRLNELDLS